jgi:hypothetical protein
VIVDGYKVVGREGRGRWLPRTSAGLAPKPNGPVAPASVPALALTDQFATASR